MPPPQGVSGVAIAALILGILPTCVIGLVVSIVALTQTGRNKRRGRGLAIAGLVLSILWLGAGVALGVLGYQNRPPERSADGTITEAGKLFASDLRNGDCFNGLGDSDTIDRVSAVPCSEAHEAEVFATPDLPGGEVYPGAETASRVSRTSCQGELAKLPAAVQHEIATEVTWLYPVEDAWNAGDRNAICFAGSPNKRTGSILD